MMASYTVDKSTGKVVIRAYAGLDKRTKKKRNLYATLPYGASDQEIAEACESLDAKASEVKMYGYSTDVESMLTRYIDACVVAGLKPSTTNSYRSSLRRHVAPYIGSASVSDIRPWVLSEMFMELSQRGKVDGTPLAQSTLQKTYAWLNPAFKWLVGEGHIASNPMDGVKRIYADSIEVKPINDVDMRKLYAWLSADPEDWEDLVFKKAVWLDLGTGLRRGEIAGLQVQDFRSSQRIIAVSRAASEAGGYHLKQPKSKMSIRRISLNAGLANELSGFILSIRDKLEGNGVGFSGETHIFCHEDGKPWKPTDFTMAFGKLRHDLGLERSVHFHSMRHTHASHLLASGTDIRTLQERLGHASVNTTLRIYSHVLPGRDAAAADTWESIEGNYKVGT